MVEIAELELLMWEERIIEDPRGQLEPLINVFNSMMRAGVPRREESGVILQARTNTL